MSAALPFDLKALQGRYIRIEPLKPLHVGGLARNWDPALFRYFPTHWRTAEEFVQDLLGRRNWAPFAIVDLATNEAIGSSSYLSIDWDHRRLEIGASWLSP